ncbi:reverse transcriptase domain-containing protein [Tanacetum coccineum]|uniref:Reverse transcriptase domain-containing protein n=1 Tax=Tanacetum coccineum TaxID=301880 RepID=A0ABQ5F7X9_9ASTR
MPSHIKTYDGSEDPEDHLKIFQSAAKTERWAMPTWCHNSTLTGNARVWFDDLPKETINSYDDLKKAFLENYLQQKKCIKDLVEIHNTGQRDEESMEEFVRRSGVKKLQAVPSTVHRMLKILVDGGVITLKSSSLLQQNLDVFDWKPEDMIGIPRHITEQRLNVQKGCSPV